jgi:peptidoglycan-associated lipoprotein
MKTITKAAGMAALILLAACADKTPGTDRAEVIQGGERNRDQTGIIAQMDRRGSLHGKTIVDAGGAADTVYFEYDKSTLRPEALQTLAGVAAWIRQHPDLQIMIAGHADERGTREYNLALGGMRATAVKNYLVSLGIPAQHLDTVSYGKERPVVVGSDEQAWSKNRRAVAEIE